MQLGQPAPSCRTSKKEDEAVPWLQVTHQPAQLIAHVLPGRMRPAVSVHQQPDVLSFVSKTPALQQPFERLGAVARAAQQVLFPTALERWRNGQYVQAPAPTPSPQARAMHVRALGLPVAATTEQRAPARRPLGRDWRG